MAMIKQVFDKEEKKRITRQVLEALPDWFGIPESREDYIKNSAEQLLFEAANMGYSFMQVKTVQMGKYKEYDDTNSFYIKMGFKEFEVFPTLWDEFNPCQIYVMSLK